MAKKQETEIVAELKKNLGKNKLVIGKDETLKNIKRGKIAKVYATNNIDVNVKEDLLFYSQNFGIELVELDFDQTQLGIICKKPFPISVVGLLK